MPATGELNWPPPGILLADATERVTIATFPPAPLPQAKDHWCWAAVCEAVSASRGRPLDQAAIVRKCMPETPEADRTYYPHQALTKLGVPHEILDSTRLRELIPACCTRDEVIITIWLKPGSIDTHAVCAFGLAKMRGETALVIYDPLPSNKAATGSDLVKVVPLTAMAGGYLEGADEGARGFWRSAVQVTGVGHAD